MHYRHRLCGLVLRLEKASWAAATTYAPAQSASTCVSRRGESAWAPAGTPAVSRINALRPQSARSRHFSSSNDPDAGLPDPEQGSFLNWPPSEAAMLHADEGLRALVESHRQQVAAAAEAAVAGGQEHQLGSHRKRNRWEPTELKKSEESQAQHSALAEPIFARVLDSSEVADILIAAHTSEVCVIDVRSKCDYTEFLVLATAQSPGQASSAAGAVLHELKQRCKEVVQGVVPGIEGSRGKDDWLLIDAGSVIVHIFTEESRRAYDLEEKFNDGSNVRHIAGKGVQTLNTMRI